MSTSCLTKRWEKIFSFQNQSKQSKVAGNTLNEDVEMHKFWLKPHLQLHKQKLKYFVTTSYRKLKHKNLYAVFNNAESLYPGGCHINNYF